MFYETQNKRANVLWITKCETPLNLEKTASERLGVLPAERCGVPRAGLGAAAARVSAAGAAAVGAPPARTTRSREARSHVLAQVRRELKKKTHIVMTHAQARLSRARIS